MVPFTTGLMALASVLIITNLFLPILYKIRMCSVYEVIKEIQFLSGQKLTDNIVCMQYLDLRYNSSWVRRLAALSFLTGMILFSSLILQSPCAAVHTMTGLPTFSVLLLVGIIGTFYTVMGGLKAVVWAGLFQAMLALTILLAIFVKGSLAFPDLEHIWNVVQVLDLCLTQTQGASVILYRSPNEPSGSTGTPHPLCPTPRGRPSLVNWCCGRASCLATKLSFNASARLGV